MPSTTIAGVSSAPLTLPAVPPAVTPATPLVKSPAEPIRRDLPTKVPEAVALVKGSLLATLWNYIPRVIFALMHVGALGVIFFFPPTWLDLSLLFGLYLIRGFGLTAGYHRYFAHRAYQTSRWFQFCLAWFGAMSVQRGPMWWAGHHRAHHKYSDQEGDPHSPIVRSIWWSHVGWIVSDDLKDADREQMKDWHKYPELWWLDKYDWLPGVLTAGFCLAIGGWSGFFWGFLLGTVCLYHCTFCVNSLCHLLGSRRFETSDRSRNNAVVALITMGEGWHNNHHHYPSAARQGFMWWEFDLSYMILKTLSWVGIVWGLRQPTPRALAAKRITC